MGNVITTKLSSGGQQHLVETSQGREKNPVVDSNQHEILLEILYEIKDIKLMLMEVFDIELPK